MYARVKAGDAFWVPGYFPFCHIAARSGSLEFFGFTTSARKNRLQLLIGATSILQTLRIPERAAAFCVSEERVKRVDRYGTARARLLYCLQQLQHHQMRRSRWPSFEALKVIKSFGNEMVMGFD
ncbi:hypothetical protein POTOM_005564 [Populus tomentosa]|uniref:Cupin type-1 domain-containing protein n=1 Tax=Populus tomentosa TaxID=118781 RepID=A0A8X8AJK8_POPTO|nr:hypothetical protein POTOM_005564 [Populus tomentosa]